MKINETFCSWKLRVLEHRNTQHVSFIFFSFRASWGTPLMLGQMRARLVPISIPRRCPWPHLAPWIARQKALIPSPMTAPPIQAAQPSPLGWQLTFDMCWQGSTSFILYSSYIHPYSAFICFILLLFGTLPFVIDDAYYAGFASVCPNLPLSCFHSFP